MRSYYTGKHTTRYNRIWQAFSQKTLDVACAAIDVESLNLAAQRRHTSLRILDVACGTGLLLERLMRLFPAAELYGVDASTDMLIQAQQLLQGRANIHLHSARLSGKSTTEFPYPPAFFDLITCTNALHYFLEPAVVLRMFRDGLVEQGQLVLEDYTLRGFPFSWKGFEGAIRVFDPEHHALVSQEEALRLCRQADLQGVVAQTFPIDLFCRGWVVRAIRL